MPTPQIATLLSGPAMAHPSDFVPFSTGRPTAQGELLPIFATCLGPITLSLDPGEAFPATPPALVNSPVEVLVNGKPAELIGAVGFPGAVDGYQINFRLPADTPNRCRHNSAHRCLDQLLQRHYPGLVTPRDSERLSKSTHRKNTI